MDLSLHLIFRKPLVEAQEKLLLVGGGGETRCGLVLISYGQIEPTTSTDAPWGMDDGCIDDTFCIGLQFLVGSSMCVFTTYHLLTTLEPLLALPMYLNP
jgi:hypothetical protein